MIIIYCMLGVLIAIPVCPLLFIKCIINIVYNEIQVLLKGKVTKIEMLKTALKSLFKSILVAPLMALSFIVDLLKLAGSLLQDEKYFEYKY